MNAEYQAIFEQRIRARVLEKRSTLLEDFLREHGLPEPKSVEFAPVPDCSHKRCFVNVEQQVRRAGGTMETGWLFWEYEHTVIKTEAHAVWITPQKHRRDITPQRLHAKPRLLFLPDTRVALKRGYTAAYKTILSPDPKVIALERFDTEFSIIVEQACRAVGEYATTPLDLIKAAAERVGLPWDVAEFVVARHHQYLESAREHFGS